MREREGLRETEREKEGEGEGEREKERESCLGEVVACYVGDVLVPDACVGVGSGIVDKV